MSTPSKKAVFIALALGLGSFLGLAAFELAARAYYGEWRLENYAAAEKDLLKSSWPSQFDPLLGWSLKPGSVSGRDFSPNPVHVDALGLRVNGQPRPGGPAVLALGDSFTFGAEVGADHESWPAFLEMELGRATFNGGVYGYGLDQTVLRLEALLGRLSPEPKVLVFSFIADDVPRCERSLFFGATKPYFTAEGGSLKLHAGHLAPPRPGLGDLDIGRRLLGYSFFLHKLLRRAFPGWWLAGALPKKQEHQQGEEVACLLMGRLAGLAKKAGLKTLVIAEYTPEVTSEERRLCAMVLGCAKAQGLQVLDLGPKLAALKASDPAAFGRLYVAHMTAQGNRLVAGEVAAALRAAPAFRRALGLK